MNKCEHHKLGKVKNKSNNMKTSQQEPISHSSDLWYCKDELAESQGLSYNVLSKLGPAAHKLKCGGDKTKCQIKEMP